MSDDRPTSRRPIGILLIVGIALGLPGTLEALNLALQPASPFGNPQVLAFYYTWYGNTTQYDGEPANVAGRWMHWNENVKDAAGNPIDPTIEGHKFASHNTPVLGLFDAFDNATIDQHMAWAKAANIDALICTWWGRGDWTDLAFEKVLRRNLETGSDMKFTVYFESVQKRYQENGTEIAVDMEYIVDKYGDHPNFLTVEKEGKAQPVIFVYATNYLGAGSVGEAVTKLHADGYNPFLMGDIQGTSPSAWHLDLFDGIHTYNPVGIMRDSDAWQMTLRNGYAGMIHAGATKDKLVATTVIPGYNDLAVRDGFDFPRGISGQTYKDM